MQESATFVGETRHQSPHDRKACNEVRPHNQEFAHIEADMTEHSIGVTAKSTPAKQPWEPWRMWLHTGESWPMLLYCRLWAWTTHVRQDLLSVASTRRATHLGSQTEKTT